MDVLKGFDLTQWWNLLIAVGLAIIVAALAAHERGLIFVALGMISWGFGESKNHKQMIQFMPQGTLTSFPRLPTPFGFCLDGAGLFLIGLGLWKLLIG